MRRFWVCDPTRTRARAAENSLPYGRVQRHGAAERMAESRSTQRSSASSIPTLSRRSEGGRCPCPGTADLRSMVDSTAPRLVAWRMSLTFRQTLSANSAPPSRSNEMMVPKPLSTRFAVACVGWDSKPGYRTRVTSGCISSRSASIMAVCCARCKRSASGLAPRTARNASSVPGVAPVNSRDFLRACQSASSLVVATPANRSEWPPINLVADCRDTVAPKASGS